MAHQRKPVPPDTVGNVLRRLSVIKRKYPDADFATVVSRREEFTPHLLQMLEQFVDNPESVLEIPDYFGHLAAMYLLAQFREEQALPLLLRLCIDTPALILDTVLCGAGAEDLSSILASVSGGSIDALRPLAEARGISPDTRSIALEAMAILLIDAAISRAELVAYLSTYADQLRQGRDFRMWTPLARVAAGLALHELREPLRWACEQHRVDPDAITSEELEEDLSDDPDAALLRCAKVKAQHQINNAANRMRPLVRSKNDAEVSPEMLAAEKLLADVMEDLLERNRPARRDRSALSPVASLKDAGPNAPCSCGSGKKFKDCCGS